MLWTSTEGLSASFQSTISEQPTAAFQVQRRAVACSRSSAARQVWRGGSSCEQYQSRPSLELLHHAAKRRMLALSTIASRFAVLLDRRTRDIAVRAEYATIPWLWLQPSTAASAVNWQASVGMVSVASSTQLANRIHDPANRGMLPVLDLDPTIEPGAG
jgi:hypothetical protein